MKGDLSKLPFPSQENYTGVLYQQGRVRLDQDDNAEHFIAAQLRQVLGRDVIGAGVAAVPADASAGFRVIEAAATNAGVNITLTPGRIWLEGLHLEVNAAAPVVVPATYYGPPVQSPQANTASIAANVRDAVILETWEEALSAFQDPVNLLEPALGGPDTTERVQLNFALRLFRLGPDQDCRNIGDLLRTDPNSLGRLSVTPAPVVVIGGDCPVDTGGGYTGLEHYLYRLEVATPDAAGDARFKWSRFNGGLVGRGQINAAGDEVTIVANQQMINHCGLTSFHLEALQKPGPHEPWRIAFTADASLVSDGVLSVTNTSGAWPAPAGVPVFFRLWDGIRRIADFVAPAELENGIQLQFDAPAPASGETNFRQGDYWSFPVRAAGTGFDPSVWPSNAPPHGIRHHRAPLAEIHWTGAVPVTVQAPENIHDCRRPFPPLTRQRICCTFIVGDGVNTFGDFNSIEEAVASLPADGGEICLMPGIHTANVVIRDRRHIKIHGCGKHTLVIPREQTRENPIFHIVDSESITIAALSAVTFSGTAMVVEGSSPGSVSEIEIVHNRIVACQSGIVVANGAEIGIRWNRIRVVDRPEGREAIILMAEGAWIERNDLGIVPAEENPPGDGGDPDRPRPEDPCEDPERVYRSPGILIAYVDFVLTLVLVLPPQNPFQALGGIRLSGGAERVRVLENKVQGGAGDGVHLGGSISLAAEPGEAPPPVANVNIAAGTIAGNVRLGGQPADDITLSFRRTDGAGRQWFTTSDQDGLFFVVDQAITAGQYQMRVETPGFEIAAVTQQPGGTTAPTPPMIVLELRPRPAQEQTFEGSSLAEILIERNEIANMGLSGIGSSGRTRAGVTTAPTASSQFGIPVFQLEIDGNRIHHCLRNPFTDALLQVAAIQGLGGISLGICDEVTIGNNRIEHCGTRHIDPVTGIFAALADHIEVRDNTLHNNGPFDAATQLPMRPGIRGGIVLRAMAMAARSADDEIVPAVDQPAARIYDNVVRQPAGLALYLLAYGPVTVQNNFLSSDRRGPMPIELLAGAVLIVNAGARESGSITGGSGVRNPTGSFTTAAAARLLPDGKTLYADNQVRFGVAGDSYSGQLIWTRGDLGYNSNQADYLGRGFRINDSLTFFINTVLIGDSVRAGDSRFKEGSVPVRSPVASLLSASVVMNITSDNQGDHCIFATNQGTIPVVSTPNQVIDTTFCPQLGAGVSGLVAGNVITRGI